jgi:surfeit locus 1 family protein
VQELQYITKRLQFESMDVQVRFLPLMALLALALLFASLGQWQIQRKIEKQQMLDRFEQAPEMALPQALDSGLDFVRVELLGHYEGNWHLLLDNKIWKGRPGVHVLSLFYPKQGPALLVDRGWVGMNPDRRSLPEFTTPGGERVISGLLSKPPGGGVQLGQPDVIEQLAGPVLLTYLDIDDIASRSGLSLAPMLLKLDASDPSGFEDRDWQPAVILPPQHQAYAVQWFALAVAAIVLLFTFGIRIRRRRPGP